MAVIIAILTTLGVLTVSGVLFTAGSIGAFKAWRLKSRKKAGKNKEHDPVSSGDTNPCVPTENTQDHPTSQLHTNPDKQAFAKSMPGFETSLSYSSSFESSPEADMPHSTKQSEVVNLGTIPELDCLVITSYGDSPPSDVAVKKKSAFLSGVGEDSKIIQDLIYRDDQKNAAKIMLVCHFRQETVNDCKREIEDTMNNIKLQNKRNPQRGLLIWYTGHGQKDTGNWALKDGYLTFKDIYQMYRNTFKGRYLYVVSDCCYSGAWVVECARLLDEGQIKCSHAAKINQIYLKVFAACLPNEPAYDKFYTKHKGVKLHSQCNSDHCSKTIKFAEHRKLHCGSATQTTLAVDFTRENNMCILDGDQKCWQSCLTWTEHVQKLCKKHRSVNYLI